ncbi:MAG: 3-methyl-2-oxobutanoate hydroxymethyltransferase [Ilumatobacteraceae bacterium]|nr:3-methyl-2-oxobutanoate hydroxymethyltransferase [Ilumatobacteraceae bacterium]
MSSSRVKVIVPHLIERKNASGVLTMVTAYDSTFASIVDEAGVDLILVGDSVATVMQGQKTTLGVSMDHMEYHVKMVASVKPKALIVGDMPFGSYQASVHDAVRNAVRLIKAGAEIVKLEGGVYVREAIEAIVRADIPVMGHIGLTPQSYHRMGGNKVQGRNEGKQSGSRDRILADARAVEEAGACAFVIEAVPAALACEITTAACIPTIGIGAGVNCDGQVLVLHDLLGLSERSFTFAKAYSNLRHLSINAISEYVSDVQSRRFPDASNSF